jgi:hypothetical protein
MSLPSGQTGGDASPLPSPAPLQFLSFLRQDLVRDLLFLWDSRERTFHTLISIGLDVCGHPSIVHGGFTSGEGAKRASRGAAWSMLLLLRLP